MNELMNELIVRMKIFYLNQRGGIETIWVKCLHLHQELPFFITIH